jgi:hypothetical protein
VSDCPTCGAPLTDRIRAWAELQGTPPKANDWSPKLRGWPSSAIIQRVFGSWNAGITAAGFTPRAIGGRAGVKKWTRETVLQAAQRWERLYGRRPTCSDWGRGTEGRWPHLTAVYREWGGMLKLQEAVLRVRIKPGYLMTSAERSELHRRISEARKVQAKRVAKIEREQERVAA